MCGIFGYVGKKTNTAEMVLDGLRLLEYRGYDSWGVAVKTGDIISVDKHVGKIGDAHVNLPESTIGIGHTRWATHGGVTDKNAHPHLDCTREVAVIHNGIVENYSELKEILLATGHTFVSETDTEVIAHMIEEKLKHDDFVTAVRETFNLLHGLNAIVVLNTLSSEIIACKNGSPLVVGEGDGEYYLASDASAIVEHTKKVLFLKDQEMVVLGDTISLFNVKTGESLSIPFETIDWKIENSQKGDYEHFMLKEIYEQPPIIANIANTFQDQIIHLAEAIKKAQGTFFIGAGTAYNACLGGVYLFSKNAHVHINTALASEFNYLEDFLTEKSLVIALSQSGETIDVIEPLNRAREKGSTIVGIVNTLGSSIYRMADIKMLLGAGPEKAVASTKAYIAKISVLLLLSYAMKNEIEKGKAILIAAAEESERLLKAENVEKIERLADLLQNHEHLYIVGRGVSYSSAMEGALKIKEVSYIHTEGLAGGELKHGTIALITKGTACIVFTPKDDTYNAMLSNAMEIKARGGFIIGVGPKNEEVFDHWIEVQGSGDGSIVTQTIPLQLLAYFLALSKGLDPDKPRNLAKSVTVK